MLRSKGSLSLPPPGTLLLKAFYNKMHITDIKGLSYILRLELRLETYQEA